MQSIDKDARRALKYTSTVHTCTEIRKNFYVLLKLKFENICLGKERRKRKKKSCVGSKTKLPTSNKEKETR